MQILQTCDVRKLQIMQTSCKYICFRVYVYHTSYLACWAACSAIPSYRSRWCYTLTALQLARVPRCDLLVSVLCCVVLYFVVHYRVRWRVCIYCAPALRVWIERMEDGYQVAPCSCVLTAKTYVVSGPQLPTCIQDVQMRAVDVCRLTCTAYIYTDSCSPS